MRSSIDDYIGGKLDLDLPARKTAAEKPAKSDDKASDKSGSREHKSGAEQKVEQNNDKSQQKKSDAERAKERERAKAAAEKAAEKRVQHGQSERMQQLREAPRPECYRGKGKFKDEAEPYASESAAPAEAYSAESDDAAQRDDRGTG